METYQKITREEFMKFFRDTEKLNELTPDDRVEIFRTVLLGSSDFSKELLNEILGDYSVDNLEVVEIQTIEKIDKEGVPNDASSRYYDVIYNNKKYPPKLIVSYANYFANGQILSRNDFSGGEGTDCFRLLELNQFLIAKKEGYISNINIWIEKTIVKGREDRNFGVRAFGKVLWSPQKDKRGADIYKNMRAVSVGDIVLHLIDNSAFVGISRVKTKAIETVGLEGTEWEGPAYLIELEDYQVLEPYVTRDQLFEEKNKKNLTEILEESEVFFNRNFTLRQGAYLTPCSVKMLALINSIFFDNSKTNLPYIESIDMTDNQLHKPDFFDFNRLNNDIYESGLVYSKTLLSRFTASLITKPFLILTGLSGSGKTKLAQAFVQWISESEKQYKIIPVGADWTNREPLLGYPNGLESKSYVTPDSGALQLIIEASKGENKNKPFFMILDEMNLSHVERYFADFLSIMESKEKLKLYSGEKKIFKI
jgi:5-methylcytosine-specific restriction enzyme B